jgi:2'-5' RNA ligase
MPTISFNLLLDEVAERAVRALWQELTASGVPAKGPAGYGPHITLAVYQVAEPRIAAYVARLPTLVSRQRSLPLRLESLGIFPETGVVFLTPRPSSALLALHRRVVHGLADLDTTGSLDKLLVPGQWMPHCTLAGHLDPAGLATAVEACVHHWRPVQGQGVAIGLRVHPSPSDHARADFAHNAV